MVQNMCKMGSEEKCLDPGSLWHERRISTAPEGECTQTREENVLALRGG